MGVCDHEHLAVPAFCRTLRAYVKLVSALILTNFFLVFIVHFLCKPSDFNDIYSVFSESSLFPYSILGSFIIFSPLEDSIISGLETLFKNLNFSLPQ